MPPLIGPANPPWELRRTGVKPERFDTLADAFLAQLVYQSRGTDPGVLWHRTLGGTWVEHPNRAGVR